MKRQNIEWDIDKMYGAASFINITTNSPYFFEYWDQYYSVPFVLQPKDTIPINVTGDSIIDITIDSPYFFGFQHR